MLAIEQHQRRPVLARIDGLRLAVHLHRVLRSVVVLHAIDRLRRLRVFDEAGNVAKKEKIAIAKQRPAVIARKRGREKTRIGEIGGGERIFRAPVKLSLAQLIELDRGHLDRNRRMPLQRKFRDIIGDRLALIPADKNPKWTGHSSTRLARWLRKG